MQAIFPTGGAAPIWLSAPEDAPGIERREPNILVDLARRLVGSRRVSLLLPTEESGVLRIAAAIGIAPRLAEQMRVRLGDPVAGSVALHRRSLLVNDREVKPNHTSRGYRTGAYISVPMPLGGDSCGVLSVSDPLRPEGFQPEDLRALEALMQQVANGFQVNDLMRHLAALEETVQQLRHRVIQAQETERQRIARDLHDEAGHALTAVVLNLDLEMMRLAADAAAAQTLSRVREQLVECAGSLHTIAFDLRPRILEDLGLHATLRSLARKTAELTDLDVTVLISGSPWTLDEPQQLAILRVVQEGLTNVRKHAQASLVSIELTYESGCLILQIEDDGIGLRDVLITAAEGGRVSLGLNGIRERSELLGGSFSIGAGYAGGTLMTVRLPR